MACLVVSRHFLAIPMLLGLLSRCCACVTRAVPLHYYNFAYFAGGRVSMQQFSDGVVLRMCSGLTFTLFVQFFDKYYVATIPKSRFEFLRLF